MRPTIGIVSVKGDLHPKAVRRAILAIRPEAQVHVFDVTALARSPGTLAVSGPEIRARFTDEHGIAVDTSMLDVIWWRRHKLYDPLSERDADPLTSHFVASETEAFVEGAFLASFSGTWVNHPLAARRAENKLYQLVVARSVGLRIPASIFTNDSSEIHVLRESQPHTVVKSITGLPGLSLVTQSLTDELVNAADVSITASPACYQAYIDGEQHLRVLVAGSRHEAAQILSPLVDSRVDATARAKPMTLSPEVVTVLRHFLNWLDLSMGVIDLKVDRLGHPHFLEVNQQGQFLWMDVTAGTSMCSIVARHLLDAADGTSDVERSTPHVYGGYLLRGANSH